MTTNARVPAGVSTGGQFATTARSESEVSLSWSPPPVPVPGAAPAARPRPIIVDPSQLTPAYADRLRQDAADRLAGRAGPLIRR